MSYSNDPFGRRRFAANPRSSGGPGVALEEVQRLAQAYQTLLARSEQQAQALQAAKRELDAKTREATAQAQTLAELKRELEIKQETLQRQSADVRKLESELVFARGALQQQDRQAQGGDAAEEMSWRERYVRLQAELENLRRRWEQRFATETTSARHEILLDMLPLADHLELAIKHGAELSAEAAPDYQRNLEATRQAFMHTLKRYGITPLEALGQPFDPNLHEAVGNVAAGDGASGTVAEVVQTGYVEGDKLVRPARVLVRA
jgi:molecular chaperone GrpE